MLPKPVSQIACIDLCMDDCLKASLCLPEGHKYINAFVFTACFSQTAEQVNGSCLFSRGPGHRVRCSPTDRLRWPSVQLGPVSKPGK